MKFLVLTIKDNVPHDLLLMTDDRLVAETRFLEEVKKSQGTLDAKACKHFLDEGYCEFADGGSVSYLDLSNTPGFVESK